MAHIIANRVRESTVTAGTGDVTLAAEPGYKRFGDRMAVGETCWYLIEQFSGGVPAAWEIGRGTCKAGNVLARTVVLESTNGNALVSFDASKKVVTMASVAPNASTAAEWQAAIGLTSAVDDLNNSAAVQLMNTINSQLGANITQAGLQNG